jgi:hypothetical protein
MPYRSASSALLAVAVLAFMLVLFVAALAEMGTK